MGITITIDAAGRVVIPKAIRTRYGLTAGARINLAEEGGRLILEPAGETPRVFEADGLLVLDPGGDLIEVEHTDSRSDRLRALVAYALKS